MKETITLNEMISAMDAGETFSIGVRTCNKRQQTGGEYIEIPVAMKENYQFNKRLAEASDQPRYRKDPKHNPNSTRNIRVLPDGNIVKVHLRLIRQFNSKTVM